MANANLILNVVLSGWEYTVDVSHAESLGDVCSAIQKADHSHLVHVATRQIQLLDKNDVLVDDLDSLIHCAEYFTSRDKGGVSLRIRLADHPPIQHTVTRKHEVRLDEMTEQFRAFATAVVEDDCIALSPFLPSVQMISELYIRRCYGEVLDLILHEFSVGTLSVGISGTPGIGKSLFFLYILHRLLEIWSRCPMSQTERILYQCGEAFFMYDFKTMTVALLKPFTALVSVQSPKTLYVVDGADERYLEAACRTVYISSPRSDNFERFVKQKKAWKYYLPVWTAEEIFVCHTRCYSGESKEVIENRLAVYGGVPRVVFSSDSIMVEQDIEAALSDVDAIKSMRLIGSSTREFPASHTLLHMLVDSGYRRMFLDVASPYVGEQLILRHYEEVVHLIQTTLTGAPDQVSRHLFERYGNLVVSAGGINLEARDLKSGEEFKLHLRNKTARQTFSVDSIPSEIDAETHYEGSDGFPAIDALNAEGMFQFTVATTHPIRGISVLKRVCKLFKDPVLYFVVPPSSFERFREQKFETSSIPKLRQVVVKLAFLQTKQFTSKIRERLVNG
jgi:hypothetical protein